MPLDSLNRVKHSANVSGRNTKFRTCKCVVYLLHLVHLTVICSFKLVSTAFSRSFIPFNTGINRDVCVSGVPSSNDPHSVHVFLN